MRTLRPITSNGWVSAGGATRWRVTPDGIIIEGSDELRRSMFKPQTVHRVMTLYHDIIEAAAAATKMRPAYLAAIIAAESGGDPNVSRQEAHDHSFGLAQFLTGTAWSIGRLYGVPKAMPELGRWSLPDRPIPQGGDVAHWREYLGEPWVSIGLLALFTAHNDWRFQLAGDPIFLAACHNAGSPRYAANPWGLRHVEPYLDDVMQRYNDACARLSA